jgi:hypothetical protein
LIEYGGAQAAMRVFDQNFREHLRLRVNSDLAALRDMLEADAAQPVYILASPKHPSRQTYVSGQLYGRRTFGDHLGILGLISAFGMILGEGQAVELVSAQHAPPDLPDQSLNLYLIGSPKSNPITGTMLARLQQGREPNWTLGPAPGEEARRDYGVALYRTRHGQALGIQRGVDQHGPKGGRWYEEDYGIVVRGPHPLHPDRLVLIMAGPHSLGTGAACLAATRSPLIQRIRQMLPEGADVADKQLTFWALVKGRANPVDHLLDVSGVEIVEAGVYQ